MTPLQQLKEWFMLDAHYDSWESHVNPTFDTPNRGGIIIYTNDNEYHISASLPEKNDKGYLGCIASSRKPEAGEKHTRGSDLPDGPFTKDTWNEIMAAIVHYELIKLYKD